MKQVENLLEIYLEVGKLRVSNIEFDLTSELVRSNELKSRTWHRFFFF